MIALLRWTFIVPLLAKLHSETATLETKTMIETLFSIQHNFLGVALGEHIGQFTLVVWTVLMLRDRTDTGIIPSIVGWSSVVVLALGLLEHLTVVFPLQIGILVHGSLVGFMLWSLWIMAFGYSLFRKPRL
jgi:hypothetical protein